MVSLMPSPEESPEDKEYNKWLDGCTPFDEMPYLDKETNTYDCFETLAVGPCKPKEWFVLNKDNPKYAICVEQKCPCKPPPGPDEYVYVYEGDEADEGDSEADKEAECLDTIEEEGYIYLQDFNGTCVEVTDTKSCPFGQWLLPNVYGESECYCANNYLSQNDEDGALITCYQEFLRGPCKEGEQFNRTEGEYAFEGKCVPTNCDDKNQIRYNDACVTVPLDCKEDQGVKLPSKDVPEAKCKNGLGERSGLISGSKSCGKGKKKDSKGKCKKTIGSNKKKGKRSPGTRGRGDVRKVCCG